VEVVVGPLLGEEERSELEVYDLPKRNVTLSSYNRG
jgi:hypothetical protein